MNEKEYNGWFNYETWLVNLHLSNNEGDYNSLNEEIETNSYTSEDVYKFAEWMKEYYDFDNLKDQGLIDYDLPMLYSDLLGAAYSEVNWIEIAEHWIEDYRADNPIDDPDSPDIDPVDPEFAVTPNWDYASRSIRWMVTDTDLDCEIEELDSFWSAFNWCVQWALDHKSKSLAVNIEVTNFDVKNIQEHKAKIAADALIAKQASRMEHKDQCIACEGKGTIGDSECIDCGGKGHY